MRHRATGHRYVPEVIVAAAVIVVIMYAFMTIAGNDLARVLRWGPGYTGGEDPLNLLRDVIDAEEIRLDRWTVVFHPEDKPEDAAQKAPPNATGKKKKVHQAQPSTQNQHQTAAITSNQTQGHLISKKNNKTTSCVHHISHTIYKHRVASCFYFFS